ncbi:Imm15 family immunity protein [Photorhabdus asymbiotica]|uniref:Imm15 family immunity protein n=1 Tax=Photorhabdus asymbiotica TaxID=291112 RepID=UPI003DA768F9
MNNLDKNFSNLFKTEYETFEEIPLFSRCIRINFLKKYDFDKRNELLLEHATKLVDKVIANAPSILGVDFNDYFSCISITKWDCISEFGCISPNFYISKRKTWLLSHLRLREVNSAEIKMVKGYLSKLNINKKKVYISKDYDSENKRIYTLWISRCIATARERIPGSIDNYVTGVSECSQQRGNLKDDGYI